MSFWYQVLDLKQWNNFWPGFLNDNCIFNDNLGRYHHIATFYIQSKKFKFIWIVVYNVLYLIHLRIPFIMLKESVVNFMWKLIGSQSNLCQLRDVGVMISCAFSWSCFHESPIPAPPFAWTCNWRLRAEALTLQGSLSVVLRICHIEAKGEGRRLDIVFQYDF